MTANQILIMPQTGKNQRLATFNVDEQQWEAFKAKAKAHGTSASKLLQGLIADYLGIESTDYPLNTKVYDSRLTQVEQAIAELAAEVAELKKAG